MKRKIAFFFCIALLLSLVCVLSVGAEPTTTAPSDLTGYTVTVPAGWSCISGYGTFYISCYDDSWGDHSNELRIGSRWSDDFEQRADRCVFVPILVNYTPTTAITFRVLGGDDSSNPTLISWLVDNNATFDNGSSTEPDPEPTVTSIPIGSYTLINPLVNIPDIDWMDGTGYSYTYDCSGTMSYGGRITTIQNFAFDLDYFQTSSIYDLTISVFTGDEWIDITLIEIYNATRTVTPLNGFQYIFFSEDVLLDSNSYETFFDIFEFYDPDEVETPDNPWIYILEKVIDALKVDLWGNFSPWDIFSTLTGIFIVVWILKLIAGG